MSSSLLLIAIFLFRLAIAGWRWQEVPYFCLGCIRHISFWKALEDNFWKQNLWTGTDIVTALEFSKKKLKNTSTVKGWMWSPTRVLCWCQGKSSAWWTYGQWLGDESKPVWSKLPISYFMQKSHSSHIFNTAPQGLYYRLQEIQIIKSLCLQQACGGLHSTRTYQNTRISKHGRSLNSSNLDIVSSSWWQMLRASVINYYKHNWNFLLGFDVIVLSELGMFDLN